MASVYIRVLQALWQHAERFRLPMVGDDADVNAGAEIPWNPPYSKLIDYQERFEIHLLKLSGHNLTPQLFHSLPRENAQSLQSSLNALFRHLNNVSNDNFQAGYPQAHARASTSEYSVTYARLERVVESLNSTKTPVDLCGGSNFSLFKLVVLEDAEEACVLVKRVNDILRKAQPISLTHFSSPTLGGSSHVYDKIDQWIQSFEESSKKRLGNLLDTVKRDFDRCKLPARESAHGVRTQLLNYDYHVAEPKEDLGIYLFCPKFNDWHIGKCEFDTEILPQDTRPTHVCQYIRRCHDFDEGLALSFNESSSLFGPHTDVLDHTHGPSSTTLKEMIEEEHSFNVPIYGECFSKQERRALAAKLALHLSTFCPWRHTSVPWDSSLIHFPRSTAGEVNKGTPFIVWQLDRDSSSDLMPSKNVGSTTADEGKNNDNETKDEQEELVTKRLVTSFMSFAKLLLDIEYGEVSKTKFKLDEKNFYRSLRDYHKEVQATADPMTKEGYLQAVNACIRFRNTYERERRRQKTSQRNNTLEAPEETYQRLVRTEIASMILVGLVDFDTSSSQRNREDINMIEGLDPRSESDYEYIDDEEIPQYNDFTPTPVAHTANDSFPKFALSNFRRQLDRLYTRSEGKLPCHSTEQNPTAQIPAKPTMNKSLSYNNDKSAPMRHTMRPSEMFVNSIRTKRSIYDVPVITRSDHCASVDTSTFMQRLHSPEPGHLSGGAADVDSLRAQQRGTDKWFESFINKLQDLQIGLDSDEPLKVAIIDSGINTQDAEFNNDEKTRIIDRKLFADGDTEVDTDGHGTFVAAIMLRLTVNVDLYIAKVTRTGKVQKEAMVKAMTYARTIWKVDMISISSGFQQVGPSDGLQDEVRLCLQQNITVFASACNDGAEGSRTYPAKFPDVLCVHSADYQGNPSRFNPVSEKEGDLSFIGEHIRPIWGRSDLEGKPSKMAYKKGTSYATPVAVAFAAFMIGFIRSRGLTEWRWTYPPWTPFGMEHMLRMMSQDTQSYRWVSPTKFFREHELAMIELMLKEEMVKGNRVRRK